MRYRMILPIAALLAALVAVPAAQAKVKVGLSEQNPAMFDQPSWQQLKLKRVRYIASWDYAKQPFEHAEVRAFMNAARAHRQEVLVTFNSHRGCFVNNKYKKKSKLAARYYKAMKSVCKKCTIMAADVLDSSDVKSYLRKFQKATKSKGRIWGLHNYKDVNRRQSKGVRNVAAVTKGQIWLTETGGFVQFKTSGFKYSLKRAAARTKYMFSLAKKNKRVKRIYVYRWFGEPRNARFDAGLVGPNGESRPGL